MIINDLTLLENAIVIAPRELHDSFLSLRNSNPLLNFQVMDIEEMISLFSYQYDDRALEEMIRLGGSYDFAKKYLRLASIKNVESLMNEEDANQVRKFKDSFLLYTHPYPEKTFECKNCIVVSYGYEEIINHYLSNIKGTNIIYIKDNKAEKPCRNLLEFSDIYEEVHYLFNAIAEDLSSGTDINDIYVVGSTGDYDILFREFSRHYGFEIENGGAEELYHSQTFKRFLVLCNDKKPTDVFEDLINEGYPIEDVEAIEKIVLRWNGVCKIEEGNILLFGDVAHHIKEHRPSKSNIVRKLNSFVAPEESHLYLVNFSMGTYPPVYEEDSSIKDEDCDKLHIISSSVRSKEAKRSLLSLLDTENVKMISFAGKAFGNTMFGSEITKTLGLNIIKNPISKVEYSDDRGLIALSSLKDKYDNYLIVDKRLPNWQEAVNTDSYKSYDFKFKPFTIDVSSFKRNYSPSAIKNFSKCPFSYYVSNILRVSTYETSFPAFLGDVYHDYLCNSYIDMNFDEDYSWDKAIETVMGLTDYEPSPIEESILDIVHDYAKEALRYTRMHEEQLKDFRATTESSFKLPLEDGSPITINGKYDKVIEFGPNSKYYCVIDYKTGGERFDQKLFQYGLSIQLPFYALYARNDKSYDGKELMGLFIAPLLSMKLFPTGNKTYEEEVFSSFKWDGVFLADVNKLRELSPNDKSDLIVGLSIKKDGTLSDPCKTPGMGRIKSAEQLSEMAEKAKQIVLEADGKITRGEFEIKPIEVENLFKACDRCEFRSICFRDDSAIKRVPKLLDDNNEDEMMDEEEVPYGLD
ncbi:MAG: PD-(D/E)XK nuclease family protein [Bacilli bacterium]|nr:PD-(D/E)XK nuclease family protein [Bacilli bacterium]